ncbi:response regulator [Glutamicibacter mishrai]|uniref:response regulator n=1 Tax=Glutamicibacter mishrai TaxID=1775880 RepID=UPI0032EBF086
MSENANGNYQVMIVDDDFRVGALHAEMVNSIPGFQALEPVQDPRTVPKLVTTLKPDLLLLDLYLPHVSGIELLRELDVDAIMISAATEPKNIANAIRHGALAFIIKPFDAKTLSAKLKGWARYRRQLTGVTEFNQQGVDRLFRALQGGEEAAPAVGAAPTEQAVLSCVKEASEPMSVAEVAEAVGVARATAQRYLAALVANESLELQLGYGTRGRPEHRYVAR